jgi:membrane-bound metal-dependent hydrolase YbcI (DUF457 family)
MVKTHMPSSFGHALAGLATAWSADAVAGRPLTRSRSTAPLDRAGGAMAVTSMALAAIPDIDLAFHAHRSVTHSVTAVAFVTIISACVTAWVTRLPVLRVATTCAVAYGTHLLLDWLAADTYLPSGIQAFWPFSHTWFISGVDLFPQTERQALLSAKSIRINSIALAWESAIMLPIAAGAWLVRVKALARLAAEPSRSHHPAQ